MLPTLHSGTWTHREMIPGGKLLGMVLVSTQKALSLVQEQVAGQRGTFGALLASDPPGRQTQHRLSTDKQSSLIHFGRNSCIFVREEDKAQKEEEEEERGGGGEGGGCCAVMRFLKFLTSVAC